MSHNIKIRNDQKSGWFTFALSYLAVAELACKEMLEHKYNWVGRHGKTKGKEFVSFPIDHLYIATIYNIKHSIEIILKELRMAQENSISKDHDARELLEELKKSTDFKKIKQKQQKELEVIKALPETLDINEIENREQKQRIFSAKPEILFARFESMVSKYHHLEFLIEKIGSNFKIEDPDNDAFRYPINGLTVHLDYEKILQKITAEDIKILENDIKELRSAYLQFTLLIAFVVHN